MAGTCAKAVLGADACARPGALISALASGCGQPERASNPRLPEVPRSAAPTRVQPCCCARSNDGLVVGEGTASFSRGTNRVDPCSSWPREPAGIRVDPTIFKVALATSN